MSALAELLGLDGKVALVTDLRDDERAGIAAQDFRRLTGFTGRKQA